MPENEDVVSKRAQRRAVGRHGVVGEISGDDLPEPFPSFGNWPVHSPSQRLLDLPELCPHAVATRLPPDPEVASLGLIANEHKAVEGGPILGHRGGGNVYHRGGHWYTLAKYVGH